MTWESQAIALLSASLLRPLVLAAAAFLILRVLRVGHPASRHAVWTAVLAGMLFLPFVSVVTPHWKLPVLPAKPAPRSLPPLTNSPSVPPVGLPVASQIPFVIQSKPAFAMPSFNRMVLWIYLAGVFAMLAYSTLGWALMRCLVRRSRPLTTRRLRESGDVVVPVAVGLLRPAVILPLGWRDWNTATRRAVLAHEFAHIRRRDAWTSALARLVRCLFWFHPLAWWVSRKVSELAELACDAVALESVHDPAAYSRVLLQFAGRVNSAGYRVALPGLAMADSSPLGKRIEQVFELSTGNLPRLRRPTALLALAGMPVMCFAATLGLGESKARSTPPVSYRPAVVLAQARPQEPPVPARQVVPLPAKPVPALANPHFDVASLKVAGPPVSGELCWGGCGGPGTPYPESQNQITYRHFTLKKALLRAYDVQDYQISGPSSLDTDAYDIAATASVGVTHEQFQVMLRNLLAERLHLALHLETRDFVSQYDLVVADQGPQLRPSLAAETPTLGGLPGIIFANLTDGFAVFDDTNRAIRPTRSTTPLSTLATVVAAHLGIPVADRTGLTGKYDIDYRDFVLPLHRPGPGRPNELALQNMRSALRQLGLALEEKTASLDVVAVDRYDALPAGN